MPDNVYLSPPAVCERLENILSRFGGTCERLSPDGATEAFINYPLPVNASAEMRRFLEPLKALPSVPDFVARLPGGRVFGPGVVLTPDGRSLARDVSEDFGKPFEQHWLLTYAKIRPPVRVPGSTAVVAVTLGDGYCHWLLEELPRLLSLTGKQADPGLIAHTRAAFIREAFALGRFPGRLLEARRYSHFECEQLVIPSLVGRSGHPTPRVVELLAEFTAPLRVPNSGFGERLYISREKAGRRRVINEAELWQQLEPRGFTKILLEDLSWKEQINAFAQAKVIVAPHGAGLANLVFCRPGAQVVEFFNRAYVNPCFWRLAGVTGLDYHPVVFESGEPLACDPKANRQDIHADINAILNALIRS